MNATPDPKDPRLTALINLLGRTGAKDISICYQDEVEPVVWAAVATWKWGAEAAGALDPVTAVYRLAEQVIDGGTCAHCGKPSGISDDWTQEMPLAEHVCWYVYDPELKVIRRGCEGETTGKQFTMDPDTGKRVGRNDPCPCKSGKKFKNCHGA